MRNKKAIGTVLFLIVAVSFPFLSINQGVSHVWVSFGMVIASILLFLLRFEKRKIEPRELVLLAILAAIAAVGRIPFASIPSVQPTTFVIMMSGLVFGAESGFIVGIVAALSSNMILGQGPWTPWQMAAWGLVGLTAGLFSKTGLLKGKWGRIVFGIIWGFLFGWIMNLWGFLAFTQTDISIDLKALLAYFAASALFDTMHAASNVFFLLIFGEVWIKIMTRFKQKYGLLEK